MSTTARDPRKDMSPIKQVDLDALGDVVIALRNGGLAVNASMLESAIAELRAARELLASLELATEAFFRCSIANTQIWIRRDENGGYTWEIGNFGNTLKRGSGRTLPEALAAAREWEAKNG